MSTPTSAGMGKESTPASHAASFAADFKTPGAQARADAAHSPSAAAGMPSMSVPQVRTGIKARPSRLGPSNPATPLVQQVHSCLITSSCICYLCIWKGYY
jgi:hypothetical protein